MATRYTRSTDGSDSDGGTTWALAKATLAGVAAIDTAGDDLWVSQSHAESTAGAVTIALAGTLASPTRLLCGNDAAEPPTALATTGTVTATGSNSITLSGNAYVYGLTFTAGANINLHGASVAERMVYEQCVFSLTAAGTARLYTGGQANVIQSTELRNCQYKFAHANNGITIAQNTRIIGGSFVSGTTSPTTLFFDYADRTASVAFISGLDMSNLGSSFNFVDASTAGACKRWVFRNCKLPSSWAGNLINGTQAAPGARVELINCDSTDTNYRLWVEEYAGSIKHETTLIKTGGASDGTTGLSWKLVTSANAKYPLIPLVTPDIQRWNATTGSSVTITIDILRDSATNLKDDEIWIEAEYLGTSGFPLSTVITDSKADVLATGADQTSSGATWTTTGMSNPNAQKLSVSFTPQEKGLIVARVCCAKASTTVYVDPVLQVS